MKTDTPRDVERFHIDRLRAAGAAHRSALASDVTNSAWSSSWANLEQRRSELTDRERQVLFVRATYGSPVADMIRRCIERERR